MPSMPTHALLDSDFLWATGTGFIGLLTWTVKVWSDPGDDRLSGALVSVLRGHSKSLFIAAVAYVGTCMALHEMGQLTIAAAIGAGFMGQSVTDGVLARYARKLDGNGGKGK